MSRRYPEIVALPAVVGGLAGIIVMYPVCEAAHRSFRGRDREVGPLDVGRGALVRGTRTLLPSLRHPRVVATVAQRTAMP